MDALDMIENLERLDVKQMAVDSIEESKETIADLNAVQLAQGKRSTGTDIKPAYHPLTIELKSGRSGLAGVTDRVTLYDTGEHYRQLYAEVKGEEIEYGSRDSKSEKLANKYGETIYGLTEEHHEELVEQHLRPAFYDKAHTELGL